MSRLVELRGDQDFDEHRRWFSSSDMDLIVWENETRSITAFELYYNKNIDEHVLIWRKQSGFRHLAVDDGEQQPVLNYKESPILVPDGIFDADRIRSLFEQSQQQLPTEVAKFVGLKLEGLVSGMRES